MPKPSKHQKFSIGTVMLDRYKLISLVGEGGCGVVYKAEQISTGQPVAIKILKTEGMTPAMRKEQQARFQRETQLLGKLGSPHSVGLIDSGIAKEHPIMVLEFVDGESLRDRFKRGPLYPSLTKRIVGQILEALAEAHNVGIVHRDLKPDNIMLIGKGRWTSVKVLDFGLSGVAEGFQDENYQNITRFGQIRGTPAYMAPEQLTFFSKPRLESDLYAAGLILLECLTGQQAVVGEDAQAICQKQLEMALSIPPSIFALGFGAVIERACHKEYQQRYRSAILMLSALDEVSTASDVIALPPSLLNAVKGEWTSEEKRAKEEVSKSLQDPSKEEDPPTMVMTERPSDLVGYNLFDDDDDDEQTTVMPERPSGLSGFNLFEEREPEKTFSKPHPKSRMQHTHLSPQATLQPTPQHTLPITFKAQQSGSFPEQAQIGAGSSQYDNHRVLAISLSIGVGTLFVIFILLLIF